MQGKLSSMTSNWIVISPTRTREDRNLCDVAYISPPTCDVNKGVASLPDTARTGEPVRFCTR